QASWTEKLSISNLRMHIAEQNIAARYRDFPRAARKSRDFVLLQLVEQRHMRQQRFDIHAVLMRVHGRFP
ncbi:MAG TPA: hypothetical protein PLO14_10080, partial [Accumulibacter sp.]|nr:hypothetical protein [Accumulibacter sp.]